MNRNDVINLIFDKYNFQSYLHIGAPSDEILYEIKAPIKQGVTSILTQYNETFFDSGSNDFFASCPLEQKYDVIYIEGIYVFEQVYSDIQNAKARLSESGFIIIGGINPPTESCTVPLQHYTSGAWLGQAYKAYIRSKYEEPDWAGFALDLDFGYGILTPQHILENRRFVLGSALSWAKFEEFRKELLQLITVEEYVDLLK